MVAVDFELDFEEAAAAAASRQDDCHFSLPVVGFAAAAAFDVAIADGVVAAAAVGCNAFAAADAFHTVSHPVLAIANHSSPVPI